MAINDEIQRERNRILDEITKLIEFASQGSPDTATWRRAVRYALVAAKDIAGGRSSDEFLANEGNRSLLQG